jgi:NAD(P)-dependent dehydrogenase (short-subunit alcohol dehydrogenase family)
VVAARDALAAASYVAVMANPRRVAIVTGIGPGIGRSTALGLAREGCAVVLAARSAEILADVAAEVRAFGVDALEVPTDVGDLAQCARLVDQAMGAFGRVDVLVNSAAKGAPNHTILNADLAEWQQAWQVNVLGPIELARRCAPSMQANGGGSIVMVSTLAVRAINPGQGAYAATKAALTVAAQTLAREVGRHQIRVNIVVPGFVPGPNADAMFGRLAERRGVTAAQVQTELAEETALRRLPSPEDIADAIVFLCSDRARSITGQTLDVNGGRWFA